MKYIEQPVKTEIEIKSTTEFYLQKLNTTCGSGIYVLRFLLLCVFDFIFSWCLSYMCYVPNVIIFFFISSGFFLSLFY